MSAVSSAASAGDAAEVAADAPVVLDPTEIGRAATYYLLTGLVVPRPIGWISTVDADGHANLAPFSFFNVCSDDPPVVYFSASQRQHAPGHPVKDSVRNVLATREFVVNIVSADLLDQMVATAASLDPQVDEFEHAGLRTAPSVSVRPHRVAAARAALECRLHSTVSVGAYEMILGEVVTIVASPEIVTESRIDVARLQPVGRLNASFYTLLGEIVQRRRPT